MKSLFSDKPYVSQFLLLLGTGALLYLCILYRERLATTAVSAVLAGLLFASPIVLYLPRPLTELSLPQRALNSTSLILTWLGAVAISIGGTLRLARGRRPLLSVALAWLFAPLLVLSQYRFGDAATPLAVTALPDALLLTLIGTWAEGISALGSTLLVIYVLFSLAKRISRF